MADVAWSPACPTRRCRACSTTARTYARRPASGCSRRSQLDYRPNSAARALAGRRSRARRGQLRHDPVRPGLHAARHRAGRPRRRLRRQHRQPHAPLDRATVLGASSALADQSVDGVWSSRRRRRPRALPAPAARAARGRGRGGPRRRHPGRHRRSGRGRPAATRHLLSWATNGVARRRPRRLAGGPGARRGLAGDAGGGRAPRPPPLPATGAPRSGYEVGRQLLADADVTASSSANDQMALGMLRAFHERGRGAGRRQRGRLRRHPRGRVLLAAADHRPSGLRRGRPAQHRRAAWPRWRAGRGQRRRETVAPELIVRASTQSVVNIR